MAVRKRRRQMDEGIQDEIEAKVLLGWSGVRILKYLEEKLKTDGKNRHLPELRTIQRMISESPKRDESDIWSLETCNETDSRFVLDVIADGILNGYCDGGFSCDVAEWLVKVSKAAPGAPPKIIFYVALSYLVKKVYSYEGERSVIMAMDQYLAFTPWKDQQHLDNYKSLVIKGKVERVPFSDILVDELFTAPKDEIIKEGK